MVPAIPTCSTALLERCLSDSLTPAEESRLEQHLAQCAACREQLEQLAASPEHWSRTAKWLRDLPGSATLRPELPDRNADVPVQEFKPSDFVVDELRPSEMDGAIGRLDDIEILEVVGSGAMGVVLKGYQPKLQRLAAVKVLRPELCHSGVARQRFLREARAAAAVVHPHVMPIYSVHAEGRLPYLVMPYLACESLQEQLDRDGPLELIDVLRVGLQVAQALEAAHAQGLVHRDVKPSNILVEHAGQRVLLADFGLARAVDDVSMTQTGLVAGTPQYMSPEQARGIRVDHRSDLFSFGSVLYALWTGRSPFRAETALGVIRRLCEQLPQPMSNLRPETPDWFAKLVSRLHGKSPELRIQSSTEAVALLEQCLRHLQQPSVHELPAELLGPVEDVWSRRVQNIEKVQRTSSTFRSIFLILGGSVMVAGVGILIGMLLAGMNGEPQSQADPANQAQVQPDENRSAQTTQSPGQAEEPLVVLAETQVNSGNQDKQAAETKYGSAEEAWRVGAAFYNLKEYAKTREPFEAALKLAPDDAYQVKVYRALLPAYRQESDWLLCAGALEFIIAHSSQDAERSLARTELMGFLRARGKTEEAVKRYEARLKQANDEATLYILIEVYSRLKQDPRRASVLLEQWSALQQKSGQEMKVTDAAKLAGEYVKQKKYQQGAELYEATAPRDAKLAAWHYKEAASAWLKAGDKERAVTAAKAADESEPEQRGELLEHFWHRGLADVYFDCGEFKLAVPHYEQAIAKTKIEGYLKACESRLAEAKAEVEKKK